MLEICPFSCTYCQIWPSKLFMCLFFNSKGFGCLLAMCLYKMSVLLPQPLKFEIFLKIKSTKFLYSMKKHFTKIYQIFILYNETRYLVHQLDIGTVKMAKISYIASSKKSFAQNTILTLNTPKTGALTTKLRSSSRNRIFEFPSKNRHYKNSEFFNGCLYDINKTP